jgi:hypothetical protein
MKAQDVDFFKIDEGGYDKTRSKLHFGGVKNTVH